MSFFKNISKKPFIAAALAASISISGIMQVNAAVTVKDLDSSSEYARPAIEKLITTGVIIGDESGNFNPHSTITRAEMATMLVKALNADMSSITETPTFTDVPANYWGYPFIEAAYRSGLFKGVSADMFDPEKQLSREEMAAIFIRAIGLNDSEIIGKQNLNLISMLSDKSKISDWAADFIEFALDSGIMKGTGDTTFAPDQNAEREQAAVMIDRVLENREEILDYHKVYSGKGQYPELYSALRNKSYNYAGDFKFTQHNEASNSLTGETVISDATVTGYVYGRDFDVYLNLSQTITDIEPLEMQYRVMNVAGKSYVEFDNNNQWIYVEDETNTNAFSLASLNKGDFLHSYKSHQITKTENAEINGSTATKYSLVLNVESLKNMFSSILDNGELASEDINKILNEDFSYKVEFYLNSNNQIIYEEVSISAIMNDAETGEDISFSSILSTEYSNIGKKVELTAPDTIN